MTTTQAILWPLKLWFRHQHHAVLMGSWLLGRWYLTAVREEDGNTLNIEADSVKLRHAVYSLHLLMRVDERYRPRSPSWMEEMTQEIKNNHPRVEIEYHKHEEPL